MRVLKIKVGKIKLEEWSFENYSKFEVLKIKFENLRIKFEIWNFGKII